MIAFAVESMGGTVVGAGLVAPRGEGESSTARPSPVTVTRTSLDGRAGPGLHTLVGTAGSWDGPPRCSCDGIPDANRPPRRIPSCSTASSASRAPRRSRFALHTTAETRSSGVETPPQWRHGRRPTPGGAVRRPAQRSRIFKNPCRKQSTTVIRETTSGTHSASTPNRRC